jgi:hypothetical protein
MVSPDSNAGPLIFGGLQNSLADTFAKESTESEEHVKQEMAVMRDDLELLRHAVQARKAGKLEVSELAEARQAANDCSGWLHQTRRAASARPSGARRAARTATRTTSRASRRLRRRRCACSRKRWRSSIAPSRPPTRAARASR